MKLIKENPAGKLSIAKSLDVVNLLDKMPLTPIASKEITFLVKPEALYQRAILQGKGNCSNRTFGAAFYLIRKGVDFRIIKFIPISYFFQGRGHTVLEVPYRLAQDVRLVDLSHKMLIYRSSHPLQWQTLAIGPFLI